MATTTLLRLGRVGFVKCLQLERLGVLRNCPAALCTQEAGKPTKPAKKAKPASKTAESPDERTSLLAYKTAVAFPVRLSEPGIFQTKTSDSEAASTATAKTVSSALVTEPITAASEPVVPEPEPAKAPTSDPAVLPEDVDVITDKAPPLVDAAPESLHDTTDEVSTPGVASTVGDAATSVAAHLEPDDPGALESSSSSSSSSSASDSDSDSDSEDEKSEDKSQTGVLPEEVSEPTTQKEGANVHEVPQVVREKGYEAEMDIAPAAEGASEPVQEDSPAAVPSQPLQSGMEIPSSTSEEFVDSAPEISTVDQGTPELSKTTSEGALQPTPVATADGARPAVPGAQVDSPTVAVTEVSEAATISESQTESEVPADPPGESREPAPAEDSREAVNAAVEPLVEATTEPEEAEAATGQTAAGAAAGVSTPGGSTEELLDPAPVIAEGEGEELQMEAPAEPPEEAAVAAAVAAPPEPEEPFDNSTYKNNQHHSYTPFTFVDMDVEMSKYRLPQPSTGRPSPQH